MPTTPDTWTRPTFGTTVCDCAPDAPCKLGGTCTCHPSETDPDNHDELRAALKRYHEVTPPDTHPTVRPPVQTGWVCPRCGTVNAPFVSTCHCHPIDRVWTATTT